MTNAFRLDLERTLFDANQRKVKEAEELVKTILYNKAVISARN